MNNNLVIKVINILLLIILTGCNKDNPISGIYSGQTQSGIQGNWQVDRIQMLQAPNTGTANALMKTALMPFGLMSASNVGWANVTFGLVKWNQVISGTNENLNRIQFSDNSNGWIFSTIMYYSNNSFIRTTDGGNTWNKIYFGNYYMNNMNFVDANTGWASGTAINNENGIFYTSNGGMNWNLRYNISNGSAYSVYFINNQTGWASGTINMSGVVFKTTNGGTYWNSQFITSTTTLNNIKFLNNLFGYTSGHQYNINAIIKKTLDGGNNWIDISAPGFSIIKSLQFVNENTGFVLGNDNSSKIYLYKTVNGGTNWNVLDFPYNANAIFFLNSQMGYAVGENGLLINTTNGGDSWSMQAGISNVSINNIYFINSQSGYAVGSYGTILKQSNYKDSTLWSLNGKITNPIIKSITKSGDGIYNSYGSFYTNDTNIIFHITDFSGGLGNVNTGNGTFTMTDKLNINLNLANNEKWLITLKR